ncbi:MAG: glycosyl hydrolase family 28-related protein [Bacteroidota bacterium]
MNSKSLAQTIPSGLLTDWSSPGYRGDYGINIPETDVTSLGLVGDSSTDNASLLNSLISGAAGNRAVLYFPPGAYLFRSTINLRDSIIIRGAGKDSTRFIFNFTGSSGNCINMNGGGSQTWFQVNDGHSRGNNWLTLNDGGVIQPGDWTEIRQENGSWDTQPISWADYSIGQLMEITSRSGDTLFFNKPLRISYSDSLNVQLSRFNPIKEAGIECLAVQRADSANCFCPAINLSHAVDCFIRGVEGKKSISAHVLLDDCSNITVSGSYFHDAFEYNGASMHGYGVALYFHTGQCLIQDNIFRRLRHSLSFQCGANGNVVAYNYSREPNRSEFPANYGADISMHGHYPYANLFEGNIVQNIQLDQTWGPSGPGNTFFRNRAELYGILMSSGTVNSDSQLFVGNEVTSTAAFQGNYAIVGTGHFQHGNNVRGTITPSGTASLPENSLYLTGPPTFWTAGNAWPTIGSPNTLNSGTVPARDRYLSGTNWTVCNEGSPSTEITQDPFLKPATFYPNPANHEIRILTDSDDEFEVTLTDLAGSVIWHKKDLKNSDSISLVSVPDGFYLLNLIKNGQRMTGRICVIR